MPKIPDRKAVVTMVDAEGNDQRGGHDEASRGKEIFWQGRQ